MGILRPFIKDIKSVKQIFRKIINECEEMEYHEERKRLVFFKYPKSRVALNKNGTVSLRYLTPKWCTVHKLVGSAPVGSFSIHARFTKREIYNILKGSKKALEIALKTGLLEELK